MSDREAEIREANSIADEHDALDETRGGNPYVRNHVALARIAREMLAELAAAREREERARQLAAEWQQDARGGTLEFCRADIDRRLDAAGEQRL